MVSTSAAATSRLAPIKKPLGNVNAARMEKKDIAGEFGIGHIDESAVLWHCQEGQ